MKKLYAGLLAVLVLVGCTPTGPGVQPTPTPIVVPESTPGPVASATPSQEELSAEAERVYRTFFAEWKRLEREGGADEPTQILKDNGAGRYLDGVVLMLRHQKEQGVEVSGPLPEVKVRPAPGDSKDNADPRYTLEVCEDYSAGEYRDESGVHAGQLLQGNVYLGHVDGQLKVVWAVTEEVERCDI
ncbi:hypothetical protein AADG42_03175 [Ammonicoccus fulvus]|uniref:Lipoprotein n=1 Tax=Ammonicoccus fulvus TaxID=3138240 RepID=A0ABZ3FNE9_9ACTN